ncbi:hypothetical protein ABZV67_43135 [Streptomyces sp. NPDC005065]|uniref:hypothetical protein n=1 Tax=Streptomyces sp. NPDC005065 TaxID=3154461 RepID=UPI0033BD3588
MTVTAGRRSGRAVVYVRQSTLLQAADNRNPTATIGIAWVPGESSGHRAVRPRQVWPGAEARTRPRHLMAWRQELDALDGLRP